MANITFVRRNLYQLKREYGFPLDVYRFLSSTVNLETGKKTSTKQKYHVKRAIVLPLLLARKMFHSTAFGAENREFKYGGAIQVEDQLVVIDYRDLRRVKFDIPITEEDKVVYDHRLFDVTKIDEFEHRQACIITLVKSKGNLPSEEFNVKAVSSLTLAQSLQ